LAGAPDGAQIPPGPGQGGPINGYVACPPV